MRRTIATLILKPRVIILRQYQPHFKPAFGPTDRRADDMLKRPADGTQKDQIVPGLQVVLKLFVNISRSMRVSISGGSLTTQERAERISHADTK